MKEVSAGHDKLTIFDVKENFNALGDMLLQMFRMSIVTGVVPRPMKLT